MGDRADLPGSSGGLFATQLARSIGEVGLVGPVDLELRPGELTVLFGPSGAGKTTLLRLLAGLERPSAGEARLEGTIVQPGPRIGCVLQDLGLWPQIRAERQIALVLAARGVPRRERASEIGRLLDVVGLAEGRRRAPPHELSGGEAQRLAIARALASQPRALLLDEPLSALDALARAALFERVRSLACAGGRIALYVTHDRNEALSADRLLVLDRGRLIADGPPAALYQRPATTRIAELLGPVSFVPGEWRSGVWVGPFGELACDAAADRGAGHALACVRPEHVELDATGPLRGDVRDVRFAGNAWRVRLQVGDLMLLADAGHAPAVGSTAAFRITGRPWVVPPRPPGA